MKKVLMMALPLALLVAAFAGLWLRGPGLQNPALISSARRSANERFADAQNGVTDPNHNAAVHPPFASYFASKDEARGDDETSRAISAWRDSYSSGGAEKTIDHAALLTSQDPAYLQARALFVALLPALDQAIALPTFARAEARASMISEHGGTPNLIHLRELCQGLVGYADSLTAEGKASQAVAPLAWAFQLGSMARGSGGLVGPLIGVACQSIAFEGWRQDLEPGSPAMSAEAWREAAGALYPALPPIDPVRDALEDDLLRVLNTFDDLASGKLPAQAIGPQNNGTTSRWLMDREIRLYCNGWTRMIERRDPDERLDPPLNPVFGPWPMSLSGDAAYLTLSTYPRAADHLLLNRTKMLGLYCSVVLMAWQADKGAFPKSLSELEDGEYPPPPGQRWWQMTYLYKAQGRDADLFLPLDRQTVAATRLTASPTLQGTSWIKAEPGGLRFLLSAPR